MTKINVCYWKEKVPGSYSVNKRFPSFLQLDSKETMDHIYGLPSQEYPGLMKVRHPNWHNLRRTAQVQRWCCEEGGVDVGVALYIKRRVLLMPVLAGGQICRWKVFKTYSDVYVCSWDHLKLMVWSVGKAGDQTVTVINIGCGVFVWLVKQTGIFKILF